MADRDTRTALIVGASRGLGLGLVRELLGRGWDVVATVRDPARPTGLHDLREEARGRLAIEAADVTDAGSVAALRTRLEGRPLDLVFVNAGIARGHSDTVADVSTEEFTRILVTNTLSPLRVLDAFCGLVRTDGVLGVMSSGLGSVADNTRGGWEVYRASKAGLNTLMRSFAVRHADAPWSLVTVAPGWVRTDMGGPDAALDVETSMRGVADVLEARRGTRGLAYLNYRGETVAWLSRGDPQAEPARSRPARTPSRADASILASWLRHLALPLPLRGGPSRSEAEDRCGGHAACVPAGRVPSARHPALLPGTSPGDRATFPARGTACSWPPRTMCECRSPGEEGSSRRIHMRSPCLVPGLLTGDRPC